MLLQNLNTIKLGLSFKGYVPSEKYYSDFVNALLMVGIELKRLHYNILKYRFQRGV